MPENFRRAHTDEQRKIRSEVILDTTRRMLATTRVPNLSLNADDGIHHLDHQCHGRRQ